MKPQQATAPNNNLSSPMALPNQDDHSSSHDTAASNQADPNTHIAGTPVYPSQASANMKANSGLNPEADEFVPVFSVSALVALRR